MSMSRTIATAAGLITSAALVYHYRQEVHDNTISLHERLGLVKRDLEDVVSSTSIPPPITGYQPSVPIIPQTMNYVSKKLIPGAKDAWNAQVEGTARKVSSVDVPKELSKFMVVNVLGDKYTEEEEPKH